MRLKWTIKRDGRIGIESRGIYTVTHHRGISKTVDFY